MCNCFSIVFTIFAIITVSCVWLEIALISFNVTNHGITLLNKDSNDTNSVFSNNINYVSRNIMVNNNVEHVYSYQITRNRPYTYNCTYMSTKKLNILDNMNLRTCIYDDEQPLLCVDCKNDNNFRPIGQQLIYGGLYVFYFWIIMSTIIIFDKYRDIQFSSILCISGCFSLIISFIIGGYIINTNTIPSLLNI